MSRGNNDGNGDGGGSVGRGNHDGNASSTMEVMAAMIFLHSRDVEMVHL